MSGVSVTAAQESNQLVSSYLDLKTLADSHACSNHELFARLDCQPLNKRSLAGLLRNYDAHASVLRRLLLKAAAIMPEPAVGFILENVRNEYGNGQYSRNHQSQLRDLACSIGISLEEYLRLPLEAGIKRFIAKVTPYYWPAGRQLLLPDVQPPASPLPPMYRPAIAAGAITATELLAIKEFVFLQKAFARFDLQHHIWFDHVSIEQEHFEESFDLARYFLERSDEAAILHGFSGVLDANVDLYDGLCSAIDNASHF